MLLYKHTKQRNVSRVNVKKQRNKGCVGVVKIIKLCSLDKGWYSPAEVAEIVGVHIKTVHNYRNKGLIEMRYDEMSRRWFMSREDLIKLLVVKGVLVDDVEVE